MYVIATKKTLLSLLARCQGVADKKSPMPALANILLAAEEGALGGRLRASVTDLYLSVAGEVSAEVTHAGSIALPARDLFDRVKMMPEGPVQITTDPVSYQATLKAVGSARRYTLHGIPGSEFPALPKPAPDAPTLELPVDLLSLLIARTHFSISTDETRPHVNSGLFEWSGDKVRLVSTDGHRLSKMEATVSGSSATATMLIPLKAIGELRRLADEAKGDKEAPMVSITQSGPNAFFQIAGMQVSVKLVDAQFMPWEQVIPASWSASMRVNREALIDAIKAVKLAATNASDGVKLSVDADKLTITSESPESGTALDELAVVYSGPEFVTGYSAKYLLEPLASAETDDVVLGLNGPLDPLVIQQVAGCHDTMWVVMPMRV